VDAVDWDLQEARLKARIESKLAEMRRLHALPSHKLQEHLAGRKDAAALIVQRSWRRHRVQKQYPGLVRYLKRESPMPRWARTVVVARESRRTAAAVVIQRAYRAHARCTLLSGARGGVAPSLLPGLTETRRAELKEQLQWERNPRGIPVPPRTHAEAQAAHSRGQTCYAHAVHGRLDAANRTAWRRDLISRMVAVRGRLQGDLAQELSTLATETAAGNGARGLLLDPGILDEAAERHRSKLKAHGTPWWGRTDGEGADWDPGIAESA
jgi:hypothetical protein